MSMENPRGPERGRKKELDPHTSIARAIISRNDEEIRRQRDIESLITGGPSFAPSGKAGDIMEEVSIKVITNFLKNPRSDLTDKDLFKAMFDEFDGEKGMKIVIGPLPPYDADLVEPGITAEQSKKIHAFNLQTVMEFASDSEGDVSNLIKKVAIAKKIGEEREISTESVFLEDKHYEELVRRTITPEAFASQSLIGINKFQPENVAKHIIKLRVGEEAILNGTEEIIDEKVQQDLEIAKNDPDFMSSIANLSAVLQKVNRGTTVTNLRRFWGLNVLHELPEELRTQLS